MGEAAQEVTPSEVVPATEDQRADAQSGVVLVESLVQSLGEVQSQRDLETASAILSDIKRLRAEVKVAFGEPKATAHRLWIQLSTRFNQYDAPLLVLELRVKAEVAGYSEREESRLQLEQAEAAAAQRKLDDERKLAMAAVLEEAGENEAAEDVLNEAPPPPPPPAKIKVAAAGVSMTTRWSASITDMGKLIRAGANLESMALAILLDDKVVAACATKASELARSNKQNLKVPGVQVHQKKGVSTR